jgi:hypothetical protein
MTAHPLRSRRIVWLATVVTMTPTLENSGLKTWCFCIFKRPPLNARVMHFQQVFGATIQKLSERVNTLQWYVWHLFDAFSLKHS